MRLRDAAETWLNRRIRSRALSPLTVRNYRRSIDSFVEFIGADRPLESITSGEVEDWIVGPGGLKPSTLNTRAAPVRVFFSWAAEHGYCPDPCRSIKPVKVGRREPQSLNPESVRRLMWVANFRQRVMLMIAVHLGLRVSEIAALRISDWNREDETILIHGKGDNQDLRFVPEELAEILGLWIELLPARTGPLFPSRETGDHITANNVTTILSGVFRQAGVRGSAHALRHTLGTDLFREGHPANVVKEVLRHATLESTQIYTGPSRSDLREAVKGRQVFQPL